MKPSLGEWRFHEGAWSFHTQGPPILWLKNILQKRKTKKGKCSLFENFPLFSTSQERLTFASPNIATKKWRQLVQAILHIYYKEVYKPTYGLIIRVTLMWHVQMSEEAQVILESVWMVLDFKFFLHPLLFQMNFHLYYFQKGCRRVLF